MSFVVANGLRQHVQRLPEEGGAGPTVVFVHGILTDSLASYYFTLAKPFADAGLRTVMYDLRGHGRSDRPATGYSLGHFVDDLTALLAQLGVTEPVYLVGNSFGGTVAFEYTIRHPDRVAGLALIESEPPTPEWAEKMAANLSRAATDLRRPEAMAWITVRYGRHTARQARSAERMLRQTTLERDIPSGPVRSAAEIGAVRCPVFAIYGQRSDLAAQVPLMGGLLRDYRSVIVPDQEHSVLIEVPDVVRDLVLAWITGYRQASVPA